MDSESINLTKSPIIEAVVDIECDLPPDATLPVMEANAKAAFAGYPIFRPVFMQEHRIAPIANAKVQVSVDPPALQAYQFLKDDGQQLLQLRTQGFSFHRLAPYSTLDDYLPQIQQAWSQYVQISSAIQIKMLRLRYINRLLLPLGGGLVRLEDYLTLGPRMPDYEGLQYLGFLHQNIAIEPSSGHQANMVLATQPIVDNSLPILFDITVAAAMSVPAEDWASVEKKVGSLRVLKNRIFKATLTPRCVAQYQL